MSDMGIITKKKKIFIIILIYIYIYKLAYYNVNNKNKNGQSIINLINLIISKDENVCCIFVCDVLLTQH